MSLEIERADTTPVHPLAGRRIVLADDDPPTRTYLADALRAGGAAVRAVADGRAAVRAVADGPCDLLVTDLDMPEVDGLQAVAILRWDFGLTALPMLVISAAADAELPRLLEAGADACLSKPVAPAVLVRVADACLRGATPAAPPPDVPGGDSGLLSAEEAVERMGGQRRILVGLLELFLARHLGTPAAVAAAVRRNDPETARRLAHALRGTAAQIGAVPLRDAAARVEAALASASPPREAVAALVQTGEATAAAVRAWLSRRGAPRA